jgi:hypothetical protein
VNPTSSIPRDPFEAIPLRPPDVELRRDRHGLICLRRQEPLQGLRKRIADWLHYDYSRKLALDEYGTLFYTLADGATPLRTIVERLIEASGKPRGEVEGGAVLFTKKLMTMHMLQLKVPAPDAGRAA